MSHVFGGLIGPKVRENLEAGRRFDISLRDSSPELQLTEYYELVLLWEDQAALVLHFDGEDMKNLRLFVERNSP